MSKFLAIIAVTKDIVKINSNIMNLSRLEKKKNLQMFCKLELTEYQNSLYIYIYLLYTRYNVYHCLNLQFPNKRVLEKYSQTKLTIILYYIHWNLCTVDIELQE